MLDAESATQHPAVNVTQAMRGGVLYSEARAIADAEDVARIAAQARELPESVPPFREMMQRLDTVGPRVRSICRAYARHRGHECQASAREANGFISILQHHLLQQRTRVTRTYVLSKDPFPIFPRRPQAGKEGEELLAYGRGNSPAT